MAGLVLEAVGVVVSGKVHHSSVEPRSTAKIEIQTHTLLGDSGYGPVQTVTLDMSIGATDWAELSEHLRLPKGRVRMRFEFYDEEE